MSFTPALSRRAGIGRGAPLGHARAALGPGVLEHQHRGLVDGQRRVVDAPRRDRAWSSKTTARPRWRQQMRGGGRLLEHRAAGAEVAGEDRRCRPRAPAAATSGRMTSGLWQGASAHVLAAGSCRSPCSASPCSSGSSSLQHRGQPARVVEVLHQVLARRPHVDAAAASCARARRSGRAAAARPARPARAMQVDDRVGGAADRHVRADRVVEGRRGQDLRAAWVRAPAPSPRRAGRSSRRARSRRESAAGIAALPGSAMPSVSAIAAIVDAVPITMQCPAERERQRLDLGHLLVGDLAGAPLAPRSCQRPCPEPSSWSRHMPRSIGPARHHDRGHVGGGRAHQHGGRGLVAAGRAAPPRRADRRGCTPPRPSP